MRVTASHNCGACSQCHGGGDHLDLRERKIYLSEHVQLPNGPKFKWSDLSHDKYPLKTRQFFVQCSDESGIQVSGFRMVTVLDLDLGESQTWIFTTFSASISAVTFVSIELAITTH